MTTDLLGGFALSQEKLIELIKEHGFVVCDRCSHVHRGTRRNLFADQVTAVAELADWNDQNGFLAYRDSTDAPQLQKGDFQLARHWGLIESDGRGRWRTTTLGHDFVHGRIQVGRYIVTYARKCIEGPHGPEIDFEGALQLRFIAEQIDGIAPG